MSARLQIGWIAGAVVAGYLLFFHTTFLVPDSAGTYAWCRSLLFDGDVDFTDELDRLGWIDGDSRIRFHATTATGRPGNPFGIGAGILWMPFVGIAEIGLRLGDAAVRPGGFGEAHVLAASTGTAIWGLGALLLSWSAAQRLQPGGALAATLAAGFATPFVAYLYHLPTYSHVPAAFAVALVLASLPPDDAVGARRLLLCGAAVGLAAAVRAQHVVLLLLPLSLWLPRREAGRKRAVASLGALLAGFLVTFSPQLIAWLRLYGGLRVPQGGSFLDLLRPHLLEVLFSAWHGLFPWAPVLLLAIPGWMALAGQQRRLAVGVGLSILAEVWIVASVPDWWGGYAIGARRLVDLTPLFVLLLAGSFAWIQARGRRWVVPGITVAAIVLQLSLLGQVRTGALSPSREVGYRELAGATLGGVVSLPSYVTGEAAASWLPIHLVVHRDSPVQPRLDPAPGRATYAILLACWALGLAATALLARRSLRRG